jgi:alpha-D-ribose 1-methylphosphonate 5-triphosphate synthase subunit PhnI
MGYRPVKGGAGAIRVTALMARVDLDAEDVAIEVEQVRRQLGGAVDRVMSEGGLYAPQLAALAVTQTEGDLADAALLLRAYRSTLPRLGYGRPAGGQAMRVRRRISSAFKDVPGGQLLGRTRDYTHRLLDFSRLDGGARNDSRRTEAEEAAGGGLWPAFPKVSDTLRGMDLMARLPQGAAAAAERGDGPEGPEGAGAPFDVTRDSLRYPVPRSAWLQSLARARRGRWSASPTATCEATASRTTARSASCASASCPCGCSTR